MHLNYWLLWNQSWRIVKDLISVSLFLSYWPWQHFCCKLSFENSKICCSLIHNEHLTVRTLWDKSQSASKCIILLAAWLLLTYLGLQTVNLYLFSLAPVDCICMIFYICILSENRPKGTVRELAERVWSRKTCTRLLKPFFISFLCLKWFFVEIKQRKISVWPRVRKNNSILEKNTIYVLVPFFLYISRGFRRVFTQKGLCLCYY